MTPSIIRNCSNQVFHSESEYDALHRALLREDLRFLREEFTGDVNEMCLALQRYVDAFLCREIAYQHLDDYMETIGDTDTSYWDPENQCVISPVLTPEQRAIKEPLREACRRTRIHQRVKRTHLLNLMYGCRRDEDEDDEIYEYGVQDM